jgi:hypothetical protein
MHRALRLPGRAGGVKPEGDVVARGRRGDIFSWRRGEQILEPLMPLRVRPRHHDVGKIRASGDQLLKPRQQHIGDDQHAGAAVGQHEGIIGFGHQRVDRHSNNTGLQGAEKRGRPVDGIEETDQNAFLAPDPLGTQRGAEPIDAIRKLSVSPASALVDERRLIGATGGEVAVQNVGRKVIVARDLRGCSRRARCQA